MCDHTNFAGLIDANRVVDAAGRLIGFQLSLGITCADCQQKFVFIGVPVGLSTDSPTVSVDGTELRIPIAPSFTWTGPGEGDALTRALLDEGRVRDV